MNRHGWLLVSGCAWAAMMFLLFQREISPYFEYRQPPSYQMMFRDKRQPELQRWAVYFAQSRIGSGESLSEPLETAGVRIRSRFSMDMRPFGGLLLGDPQACLSSEIRLDSAFQLSEFALSGKLQGIPVTARGDRQGDKLRLFYNLLILKGELLVDFPRDATLADNFFPYQGGGRLEEGKKWKMNMIDLGNIISLGKDRKMELTELYARVVGRGKSGEMAAWQVEVRQSPMDESWRYLLWVDDQGTVLEQQMKINRLVCRIVLEERKLLSPDELKAFTWKVELSPP
jgi:hypothetical protein